MGLMYPFLHSLPYPPSTLPTTPSFTLNFPKTEHHGKKMGSYAAGRKTTLQQTKKDSNRSPNDSAPRALGMDGLKLVTV
jgi:hypothetical protein